MTIIAVVTITVIKSTNELVSLNLAMNNIEALASDEAGGSGTDIKKCVIDITTADSGTYYLKCDKNTTSSTIYKCPTVATQGYMNGSFDHCTKK